jgi:hypothetical protein
LCPCHLFIWVWTTTGKKQIKTRYKIKKQIRLLSDTIGNLYQKYKAENREKISFITFWRLKPSWIRAPSEKERDTFPLCPCHLFIWVLHIHFDLIVFTSTCSTTAIHAFFIVNRTNCFIHQTF